MAINFNTKVVKDDDKYHLTEEQKDAVRFLRDFVNNPDMITATLSGAAGTGKTYLVKAFLDKIYKGTVIVTAPTHKAVRVIEQFTNRKGSTLQALHGMKPNTNLADFNIDNIIFDTSGNSKIQNYKLVIIDEASMVDDTLDELNLIRARQFGLKVLYIGDEYQLPNPKRTRSIVFTDRPVFTLETIIRQEAGNPLIQLLNNIRIDIKYGSTNLENYLRTNTTTLNEEGKGFELLKATEFQSEVIKEFGSDNFKSNIEYVRYLAWTNDNIIKWNTFVRNRIFHNKDVLDINDLLTGYNTVMGEFNQPAIINSEDYIIDGIRDHTDDYGIDTFVVNLKSIYGGVVGSSIQIVNHNSSTLSLYKRHLSNLQFNARKASASMRTAKWKDYYAFKNTHLTMVKLQLDDGTVPKDIDYGFGMTVHKSQGSTFSNVFVNLVDINRCQDKILRKRLLYVALSRARNKAVILI